MSQELVNSVNKLTDETSALLQEYVKGNTVLQNSASEAASSAAAAKVSEGITIDKANVATQKAAEAKQFRDETAAVATGGTATLDPTPGKIPLANAEAKIHAGWLPVNVSALSSAIVDVIRGVNNEQYAASGFIHYGIGHAANNINEGMWADTTTPNVVYLGKSGVPSGHIGTSETDYPVMNIAGFTVHVRNISYPSGALSRIRFQDAPKGTEVFDSSGNCRGTGKPTLDLSEEIDPKYGDVAGSVNEAVARAFEGQVKNGDLRLGLSHWASYQGNSMSITNGVLSGASGSNSNTCLHQVGTTYTAGKQYKVILKNVSSNQSFTVRLAGRYIANEAKPACSNIDMEFLVTTDQTGTGLSIAGSGIGAVISFSSISVAPVTEEVVTERVDMFGIEGYLEKANGTLYPYGCIQGQLTTVDGVATEVDNSRPNTYFAAYTGDTTSRGRRWDLSKLTFVQMATIMSNPDHNAYYTKEGELVQFRVRQRTIAGVGNGDWGNINPNTNDVLFNHGPVIKNRVAAQGVNDTPIKPSVADDGFYGSLSTKGFQEQGVFSTSKSSTAVTALNGECYFYVMGTVPRLNQGAYHPNFNPMGTTLWRDSTGNHGGGIWNSAFVGKPTTVVDCFFYYPADTTPYTKPGALAYHGSIGRGASRPDGKFYDAIYASGQGGVIDWRLPARDMSSKEEAAKIFQKVVNGTYRGLEKLVYTRVLTSSGSGSSTAAATHAIVLDDNSNVSVGDLAFLLDWSGTSWQRCIVETVSSNGSNITVRGVTGELTRADATAGNVPIFVNESKTHISVSGDFTQLDVIGSPEEILKVDALKNGWMGSWIPKIPDGTGNYPLTKKSLVNTGRYTYTTTSGVNWVSGGQPYDTTKNITTGTSGGVGSVFLFDYTAFAKQTKPSTNKPVLNGSEGLGDVSASSWFGGSSNGMCFLTESLIGKVPTSNAGWGDIELSLKVISANIRGDNFKIQYIGRHAPVALGEPTNNSPAVKTLWYQTATNGQCNLNFAYNELKYKAGVENPWGDTVVGTTYTLPHGQMIIGDGRSTYINLNGDVCLYGAAELAIPYGYTKNKAGAGVQVAGVDL
ncbi:hypothetical protein [Vibrio vulnificus]|uniref:hypothetical protein n=1 Tax=Vibrio vulnificus TaxID=672 RepID=UPI003ED99E4A